MIEKDREIRVAREFAISLAMPVFIVDPEGSLLFYNKAVEKILGRRFEETGTMGASVWSRLFYPTDADGAPIFPEKLPLMIALHEHRPAHDQFWIRGLDNVAREIEVTAFPLITQNNEFVGAIAIFWDVKH
ncbi:MAG: PAS domain-containing protein [Ignavibacteriae bacterium]|nr:PAS domain-containing protein [Ignavibacteriota bacterium]